MKKNIYLISYDDYDFDGRLRCLIKVFSKLGILSCTIRSSNNIHKDKYWIHKGGYLSFVLKSVKNAFKISNIDYLVLDNRKATVPGLIIRILLRPKCIIQDSRELYLINEVSSLASKIGCVFEKYSIQKADIVICANRERAKYMKDYYNLSEEPIVYENLRRLEYESNEQRLDAERRLSKYLIDGEIRLITSSGCDISRTNDVLVENLNRIKTNIRLFIVGRSSKSDEEKIQIIIQKHKLSNVEILGMLNQSELKYLIENSHIGIVNYHQKDMNNKYCASGKLYEFIYEGIPVVTTTNPPLKYLCDSYGIGEADDLYYRACNKVIENYDKYKNAVDEFTQNNTVENNDMNLEREVVERIIH